MRILYFHQYFSTPKGTTGTRSYEFSKELIAKGHKVTVVCGSGATGNTGLTSEYSNGIRRGNVEGIEVIEIELSYSNYLNLIQRAKLFIKFALKSVSVAWREDYDILYATSTPLTMSIPGIAMRILRPQKKFIFEVRDLWPELPKAMGVLKNPVILFALSVLEKISYMAMHKGIALSPGIQKGMSRGFFKKEIELIPNGCDLEMFAARDYKVKVSKDKLKKLSGKIQADDFVAVFTGAHGMANGLDAVLNAASYLKNHSNIKLVFIGDGKLKPGLVERAKNEQLDNCVFIDPIAKKDLAEVMQEVDVGLMILANVPAFYYGTSPNKFFDYISCGIPVVNNYPGWIKDMLTENNCGIPVAVNAPRKLADALIKLSNEPELVESMGINSRALAKRDFNRKDLALRLVNFIETFNNNA